MRIARGRAPGVPSEERGATFTGRVWADTVLSPEDGVVVNNVFFEPGARTHWHTHDVTQVLYVLAGEGWVQVRGGSGGPIAAGDTVHIPAGEEHWHGASSASYVLHLAVSVGETDWLDEVSNEDYERAIVNG